MDFEQMASWWPNPRVRCRPCACVAHHTVVAVDVIETFVLASSCRHTQDYLRDTHHPNDWFLNHVLNIYLNLFHDHQAALERQ